MLTRGSRLTSGPEFTRAVRRGRRAGTGTLVLHLAPSEQSATVDAGSSRHSVPARVGFVVSKAVGPAVTRNRVKRRLRHIARERLGSLPASSVLVVRALPPAAVATYGVLTADFDAALDRLLRVRMKAAT